MRLFVWTILSQIMKRVVPILIFILILILRQAPSALFVDQVPGNSSILQEANLLIGIQGLGWFEDMDKEDPGVLSPVFQVFQNEEQLIISAAALRHFRFLFHCHTNPLLIDKPPPVN